MSSAHWRPLSGAARPDDWPGYLAQPGYRTHPGYRAHPGQHAGARVMRRRPLLLIMAACLAAAGLCLVTGLVGVAASVRLGAAGSRATGTALTRGPGIAATPASRPPLAAAGGFGPGPTITVTHGQRPARSRPFLIGAPGSWGLAWSYSCGSHGTFAVREQRASPHAVAGARSAAEPRGAAVTATSRAGQGSQWISGDAGRHVLVVLSSCRWTIRVVTAIREAAHR